MLRIKPLERNEQRNNDEVPYKGQSKYTMLNLGNGFPMSQNDKLYQELFDLQDGNVKHDNQGRYIADSVGGGGGNTDSSKKDTGKRK